MLMALLLEMLLTRALLLVMVLNVGLVEVVVALGVLVAPAVPT
jgi:hypothetical protein